jgi:hypothetical protein
MIYKYTLAGGCGSTRITLKLNDLDNQFEMSYYINWMGGSKTNYIIKGIYNKDNTFTMDTFNFNLYYLKINNIINLLDNTIINDFKFDTHDNYLLILNQPRCLIYTDHEFEGLIMANGFVFNNDELEYDSIIHLNGYINGKPEIDMKKFKSLKSYE